MNPTPSDEEYYIDPAIAQDVLDLLDSVGVAELKVLQAFCAAMVVPAHLDADDWADAEYFLPEGTSSEYGQWRTSRFPFLREILKVLSPASPTREITVIKGSQLGFTEVAKILMCYTIAHAPQPMLYIQKGLTDVEDFSKMKLQPTIEACETVAARVNQHRSSKGNNSILLKTFPGGFIALGGANTANSLRSKSIGYLIADELDSFKANVQEEGDPVDLAIRRCANFPNHKIYRLTTPTIAETSRIKRSFEAGDQRYYYLPCPHCNASADKTGTYFTLSWDIIKWVGKDHTTAQCLCKSCGCLIDEHYKSWMLENGEWRAHKPHKPDQLPGNITVPHASFHISALYSPLGFFSWADAVEMFIRATDEKDQNKLRVFVNTVLGEGFSVTGKGVASSMLEQRKETYSKDGSFQAPRGVCIIVAGADVQLDRIEVEVVGWGAKEESWSIEYAVFWGDTEQDQVWQEFDFFLQKTYQHETGRTMNIAATCVDSSNNSKKVYAFVKGKDFRRIFAIKGDDGWGRGLIKRPLHAHKEYGIWLFAVYVDEMKSKVYSDLRITNPGPKYCHFPDRPEYDENYFKMLTAESLRMKRVNTVDVMYWHLPEKARNEALDCRNYAIAALTILKVDLDRLAAENILVSNFQQPRVKKPIRRRVISKGIQ